MCTFKTLYHNHTSGYVVSCIQCNNLQVAFLGLLLNMDADEFNGLATTVAEIKDRVADMENRTQKCITVSTPAEKIKLFLTCDELVSLHEMLEEADTELRVNRLLAMFE